MIAILQVRKLGHREVVLFLDLDWDPDCIASREVQKKLVFLKLRA